MMFDEIRGTTYDSAHRSFPMVGKTFAHYAVLEKAGAGGMGVVFRARDETLHRDVALKLPSTNNLTDAESRERVLREARAASALNHPHICTIYEVGEVDGQPYIAMEYLAGETLNRRIPPNGLPTELVLDLGAQIADAMDHAHTQGILHRDLKSANVRMTSSGQLKVLDFGLAMNIKDTSFEGVTRSTTLDSGGVAGTLAYLAPELLQGKAPDVRTDVWSLGVLLYELAAGAFPFQGRTGFELTTAILRESPAALPTNVTPGLRAVIMHCLSKEPEKRYQHASEIRAAWRPSPLSYSFTAVLASPPGACKRAANCGSSSPRRETSADPRFRRTARCSPTFKGVTASKTCTSAALPEVSICASPMMAPRKTTRNFHPTGRRSCLSVTMPTPTSQNSA